jgi:serine/threonine protein kinase
MGTLGYMSPEQIKGKPADSRSDIFSAGAILYEMLSGKRAFHADSAGETMASILKEDPPDLSVTNQSVSPGLDAESGKDFVGLSRAPTASRHLPRSQKRRPVDENF